MHKNKELISVFVRVSVLIPINDSFMLINNYSMYPVFVGAGWLFSGLCWIYYATCRCHFAASFAASNTCIFTTLFASVMTSFFASCTAIPYAGTQTLSYTGTLACIVTGIFAPICTIVRTGSCACASTVIGTVDRA